MSTWLCDFKSLSNNSMTHVKGVICVKTPINCTGNCQELSVKGLSSTINLSEKNVYPNLTRSRLLHETTSQLCYSNITLPKTSSKQIVFFPNRNAHQILKQMNKTCFMFTLT